MASDNNQMVWIEKYRPQTLDEIMLPDRIKKMFANGCNGNFFLYGLQGTGKTTLARILARGHDTLQINASSENGIDTVRNKIVNFCQAASFRGVRFVILDEADMLSQAAQTALRGTIEMFYKSTRFIFTGNYPEKLLPPIMSRFEQIDMNFLESEEEEQYVNHMRRIVYICKQEGLKITKPAAEALLKQYFPDLRSVINKLQSISRFSKEVTVEAIKQDVLKTGDVELFEFLIKASYPPDIYAYVKSKYMNKERDCYSALGGPFIDWLIASGKGDKIAQVAVIVHKYQFESERSIDKLISILACCCEISRLFK